ncbi:hypothetical protein GE061_012918 [Apolygus lucorum]|uniref:Uncharacterized protein n=1 Tax=Apolygus lucorum TaxID=248454 RepID=A0A8S9XWC0_APOLU|nr:hypothetical protein GE061_012918 [Apolygus lucorum]
MSSSQCNLFFYVPLCLILPLIGLSAGGVLHHREHAVAKERGLLNNQNHRKIPYGGNGHGALGNYVGGIPSRPYDSGEEKLRVIKITRTYAIPYPVPVPLAKGPHSGTSAPWANPNLGHGTGGFNSGFHGPSANSYHGPSTNSYHGTSTNSYHGPSGISDLHGFPHGGPDLTHNSLEYSGPSDFFSGHGSFSGNQGYFGHNHGFSGGNQGYSGGNHGYGGGSGHSLQDDVYQRHGYSTSKPFRPSQEYTPPELNHHSYSQESSW